MAPYFELIWKGLKMTNALSYFASLLVINKKVFKLSQQIFEEHTEDSLAIDVLDVPTRQEFLDFSILLSSHTHTHTHTDQTPDFTNQFAQCAKVLA